MGDSIVLHLRKREAWRLVRMHWMMRSVILGAVVRGHRGSSSVWSRCVFPLKEIRKSHFETMTDHPETAYESVIPYCCDPNAGAVPLGIVRNVNRKPRTKRTSQDSTFIGRGYCGMSWWCQLEPSRSHDYIANQSISVQCVFPQHALHTRVKRWRIMH